MQVSQILAMFTVLLIACAVPQKSIKKNKAVDGNSAEFRLEQARITLTTGDFAGAVDLYYKIYSDTTIEGQYRQEALFNLGMMYSDDAETVEDYEEALYYFKKLLSEFRRTTFREKATRQTRYIRNQLKRMKK